MSSNVEQVFAWCQTDDTLIIHFVHNYSCEYALIYFVIFNNTPKTSFHLKVDLSILLHMQGVQMFLCLFGEQLCLLFNGRDRSAFGGCMVVDDASLSHLVWVWSGGVGGEQMQRALHSFWCGSACQWSWSGQCLGHKVIAKHTVWPWCDLYLYLESWVWVFAGQKYLYL